MLREKARRALGMLGERDPNCPPPPPAQSAPAAAEPHKEKVTLVFETDSGEYSIELWPDLAPQSVQRIVDLVGEGFYDKLPIHRAAPGQVVQLGDPLGDGYGGCGREPIASEPSFQHFAALSVGMADFGSDTASSQLFVTLSDSPQLDGAYTWIGTASANWEQLVLEDVIVRARVR
jgi:peptidylprolyl isomerase